LRVKSLAFRLIAGASLWIAAALLAGGLVLSAVFRDYVVRAFDARLAVMLDSLVAASGIDEEGNLQLTRGQSEPRFEQPYSRWYWQVADDHGPLLRSRSLWDQVVSRDYRLIGSSRFQVLGPRQQNLRWIGRDVTLPGSERTFHFVVSGNREEIQDDIRAFNRTLAWSLGALGLGLIVAVLIQVRYGLLPLRRVRAALSDVSSGRADALSDVSSGRSDRMKGDFPTEVEPLVDEINILLDNNSAVVERARTHVGNLAHALKTPLSVLTNAVAGGNTGESRRLTETVRRQIAIMHRHVDHYLVRARTAAMGGVLGARTELRPVVEDLSRTLQRIHSDHRVQIAIEGGEGLYFRGERQDLEEMLGNLVDNACKWADSRVQIAMSAANGRLRVAVDDDGPGLTPEQREAAFGRGQRLDQAVPGSGLGLAIVRDIAGLNDGSVALEASDMGGLRAVLDLPAVDVAARRPADR
jgi:signal transduction histidine kinase